MLVEGEHGLVEVLAAQLGQRRGPVPPLAEPRLARPQQATRHGAGTPKWVVLAAISCATLTLSPR